MHRLPDEVRTPRLTLRLWQVADVPRLAAAVEVSLEHLRPWMAWIAFEPMSEADRVGFVESTRADWASGGDAVYGVFREGEVVGGCGLHRRIGADGLEIGYWIHVDHTRQGYATELARGLTAAAFTIDGIDRVEIHHDQANQASSGVPRGLGFEPGPEQPDEAKAPAEVGIDCTWFITRAGWERAEAAETG